MTVVLLREIFADANASAQASLETSIVNANSARLSEEYIQFANQELAKARDAKHQDLKVSPVRIETRPLAAG